MYCMYELARVKIYIYVFCVYPVDTHKRLAPAGAEDRVAFAAVAPCG